MTEQEINERIKELCDVLGAKTDREIQLIRNAYLTGASDIQESIGKLVQATYGKL